MQHMTRPIGLSAGILTAGAALAALAASGCGPSTFGRGPTTQPSYEQEARRNVEPNILEVIAYYDPYNPWIWTDDKSRVRGVVVGALYLGGPNRRGVFGDGTIRPRLYLRDKSAAKAEEEWKLVKEWAFSVEEAFPLRTRRPSVQGYGYVLPLAWGNLDLTGREIRLVINFERADGRVARSSKRDMRVPKGT